MDGFYRIVIGQSIHLSVFEALLPALLRKALQAGDGCRDMPERTIDEIYFEDQNEIMKVAYYSNDVRDFIDALELSSRTKTVRAIELLKTYEYRLGMPHSRMIASGLYELRIHGWQEVRLFYIFYQKKAILLLGYVKKTQKTPTPVLDLVQKRMQSLTTI